MHEAKIQAQPEAPSETAVKKRTPSLIPARLPAKPILKGWSLTLTTEQELKCRLATGASKSLTAIVSAPSTTPQHPMFLLPAQKNTMSTSV
jgi:hypothetical protein